MKAETTTANSTLAIGGGLSPLDSFMVTESSFLLTSFCAEKPAHRQSANRQTVKKPQKVFVIWNKFHIYAR